MSFAWLAWILCGAVIVWPLVGYPGLLRYLRSRRRPLTPTAVQDLPRMTVIVPTYNECTQVTACLETIVANGYPHERLELIVVDSGSSDGTVALAKRFAESHLDVDVRVLEQRQRLGKASALNVGLSSSTGVLVTITDAPARLQSGGLVRMATWFGIPEVGAVSGWFDVSGEPGTIQAAEARFWRVRNELRALEGEVDSTPFTSGEMLCFRRELVRRLDEDSLADDMNIALAVRRSRHRVVIDREARFTEPRSNSVCELVRTKSRRAAGGIQELLRARDLWFSRDHRFFGYIVMPSAFLYYLPLRIPASVFLLGAVPGPVSSATWLLLLLAASALTWMWRRPLLMAVLNEGILVAGWCRIMSGAMDVRWSQERTTRGDR